LGFVSLPIPEHGKTGITHNVAPQTLCRQRLRRPSGSLYAIANLALALLTH
jgi:hypothetical protein